MSAFEPIYIFQGDEIYAIHDHVVIASGKMKDADKVEKDATEYLDNLKNQKADRKKSSATHIVTPNGLKGRILNRVDGLWGEEISVRLENGETTRLAVTSHSIADWVTEKTASTSNPVDALEARLNESFEHDRSSLAARHASLKEIGTEARNLITSGVSYQDQQRLDGIVVIAEAEAQGVTQAINSIDTGQIEPYRAPQFQVAEQAELGNQGTGDWLQTVVDDMVAESEQNDFDRLLQEGPELLAAELDDVAVADQGAARAVALSYIKDKTAGFVGEDVENYRDKFLARFEQARRRQASTRTTNRKEAAVAKESHVADAPDEALFG